jgi:hypothetical protein
VRAELATQFGAAVLAAGQMAQRPRKE